MGCLGEPTHPDCQLDNVMVIPGAWEGIDFDRDKFRNQEWILGRPVQKLLEGRLSGYHDPRQVDYDWINGTWGPNYSQYYLAGVPGHCRFLDGKKALASLVKSGNRALVGLFKRAVKHYEGRDNV